MNQVSDFDHLRLIRSPNIGPVTYRELIARFGIATNVLSTLPDLALRGSRRKIEIVSIDIIKKKWTLSSMNARNIF